MAENDRRQRSYFAAANRMYGGTELAPPGAGTYYYQSRYAGAPPELQRRAQRELTKRWNEDLQYNIVANPQVARSLDAERIGAQYGGGGSYAGRLGYTTVQLPSGGSAVVTDAVARRMAKRGFPAGGTRMDTTTAYNLGYSGTPPPTMGTTPFAKSYMLGYTGGREGGGVTMPTSGVPPALSAFYRFGRQNLASVGSFANYIGNLVATKLPSYFASEQ